MKKNWIVLGILLVIVIGAAVLYSVFSQGSRAPESSTSNGSPVVIQVTAEVQKNNAMYVSMLSGTIIFTPGDVTLFIPANALDKAGVISLTPREPDLLPDSTDTEWQRPMVVNSEFSDSHGNQIKDLDFSVPVEICFVLDDSMWEDYESRPEDYQVQYYAEDESPPRWIPLSFFTHPERHQLCGKTKHLSLFSLAVKQPPTPEPPSTDDKATTPEQEPTETPTATVGPYSP